jgi:hypothetical protein
MNSLEQMRSIFDEGNAGMVLIGMPGIEKRIARFPQFYSRIGFVHEFRPLDATQMRELLEKRWTPVGVTLPDQPFAPEVMARLIRMTGGNFRLLTRLLTQIERVLEVNNLQTLSTEVVEAAREHETAWSSDRVECSTLRQTSTKELRQITPQATRMPVNNFDGLRESREVDCLNRADC